MTWREAFLLQARSDHALWDRLITWRVTTCHQLHYFQMVTEKLAKTWLTAPTATNAPATSHKAFVRMLQVLKSRPEVRKRLGYTSAAVFSGYIDSLLGLANRIEELAPALAGLSQPNPEYPWRDAGTGAIHAPAEFQFAELDRATRPQMAKLEKLVRALLDIIS